MTSFSTEQEGIVEIICSSGETISLTLVGVAFTLSEDEGVSKLETLEDAQFEGRSLSDMVNSCKFGESSISSCNSVLSSAFS